MTPRRRLETAARKLGGSVEWHRAGLVVDANVDAPAGRLWKASGTHTIGGSCRTNDPAWVAEWVDGLIKEVVEGTEPCTEPDCDVCEESKELP